MSAITSPQKDASYGNFYASLLALAANFDFLWLSVAQGLVTDRLYYTDIRTGQGLNRVAIHCPSFNVN